MTKKEKTSLVVSEDLQSDKRVRILGIVDRIRELGVSDNVSLPQLVVVGDQSSGKSSLLEGLTGLSFPIASDLCTRFATQIVLRRTPANEAGVKITIIPGPSAQVNDATKERLLRFQKTLQTAEFGIDEFENIFDQAAECMGVPGPSTKDLEDVEKRFSDDILKVELSGPDHHHLSVVDVPGLFHNPTKYQTEEDRAIIRQLVERYITDKRTIILAVMDARNNLANQEVFSMARVADPAGKRTVGIVTKCDALQNGDEQGVLRILRNEVESLTHGWFAVKNRSTQDIIDGVTIEGRHKREHIFFSTTSPWMSLKRDRVGIVALKSFLGGLLYRHIAGEFPDLVKDIEGILTQTQNELETLGPPRQTSMEQRRFLTRVANSYQQVVADALSGNYDPDLPLDSQLKLRMHIRTLNDKFAESMSRKGHRKIFYTVEGGIDPEYNRTEGDRQGIVEWIRSTYRASRGAELPGTVNPMVLKNMFREQSGPWEDIAAVYVQRVRSAIDKFNQAAFTKMISDSDLRQKLRNRLAINEQATYSRACERLQEILDDERGGILQTVNHYFADNLHSIREERVIARLRASGFKEGSAFNFDKVLKGVHLSNENQAVNDIHDILKAYYKVAMKRFTDNVVLQVTERHMLGMQGPVKHLSPEMIGELEDDELKNIAGENDTTSNTRSELEAKAHRFQMALKTAEQGML